MISHILCQFHVEIHFCNSTIVSNLLWSPSGTKKHNKKNTSLFIQKKIF